MAMSMKALAWLLSGYSGTRPKARLPLVATHSAALAMIAVLLGVLCFSRIAQAQPQQMVVASHPLAVEAGMEVLRRGGTAVDAAIAVQMMLGVVEPQESGIGGGGFLLYYDGATRTVTAYDGRETAPQEATSNMFLDGRGKPLPFRQAAVSGRSVGAPSVVPMLELAHGAHGKLPWKELFEGAIQTAQQGFTVSPQLFSALNVIYSGRLFPSWPFESTGLNHEPGARGVYFDRSGRPKAAGTTITNPALADTMQRIAIEGARVLTQGPIAAEIVERWATTNDRESSRLLISPAIDRSSATHCAGPIECGSSVGCRHLRRVVLPSCKRCYFSSPLTWPRTDLMTCEPCT